MTTSVTFEHVGRIPLSGDNVAIASRRLEAGLQITQGKQTFTLKNTILEGHRFAIVPIPRNDALLSWGLPFGTALRDITPGDYVCNAKILEALAQRHVDFALPEQPNFKDYLVRYELNERDFKPGQQVPRLPNNRYFQGFARGPLRGVGTRNFIVVLGTTSLTASYARALADRFKDAPARYPNIDGVVAVAHTEGGGRSRPNNLEFLLRTLAGFVVHPNVGAVLAVDIGTEPLTNAMVQRYLAAHNYPLDETPRHFMSLQGNYLPALAEGERIVRPWLEIVNRCQRTPQSVEHLRIALQCGGSDAFSGVSGNPLAGWVAKETLRYGGSANLAETDELMGAEPYVLSNVRDLETARKFLRTLDSFQERVGWHGHNAEGNPSGGNNYRGLYNIAIKSIGAARKKDPEVRLDYVIDYSERMGAPGFYFMDSPGNDLEGIAGQVAAGCNLIVFTTGNGSITNFPFVPTIKVMTNTGRYQMLTQEMDVNAGRYQDGTPMDLLGVEAFELTLRIASGERSAGERTGHSQVQLWREWRQTDSSQIQQILSVPKPTGEPISLASTQAQDASAKPGSEERSQSLRAENVRYKAFQTPRGSTSDQVGLIVPTSLCSSQIARVIAEKLNRDAADTGMRYVALAHTEGCGNSAGESEQLYMRTMAGYLAHPFVRKGLLLEHGCEKTHNDAMRNFLEEHNLDAGRLGWASIQLDGGLESVTAKITKWFQTTSPSESSPVIKEVGLEAWRVAFLNDGPMPEAVAAGIAILARKIIQTGGTVVIPQNASLLKAEGFMRELPLAADFRPSLAYGQVFVKSGFHIMETPTDHQVETLTGLGATGVEVMLAHVSGNFLQSHPMVPMLQISSIATGHSAIVASDDVDLVLQSKNKTPSALAGEMLKIMARVFSHEYVPKLFAQGNTDFQMTRGLLGVSL
jgi:altronate dehydratase